jgi:hypothetical protein
MIRASTTGNDTTMQTDIVTQMRQLKLEFDSGRIDETTYLSRFQEINASVGRRCQRCKTGTATIWRGREAICASCELGR